MGERNGGVVDPSSFIGEVPGLVTISEVAGSVVDTTVVGGGAVVVKATVEVSIGAMISMLVSADVG